MRIVERGNDWHLVTCNYCLSRLEITEHDIVVIRDRDDYGDTIYQASVKCPVCEQRISVTAPSNILEARERYLRHGTDDIP